MEKLHQGLILINEGLLELSILFSQLKYQQSISRTSNSLSPSLSPSFFPIHTLSKHHHQLSQLPIQPSIPVNPPNAASSSTTSINTNTTNILSPLSHHKEHTLNISSNKQKQSTAYNGKINEANSTKSKVARIEKSNSYNNQDDGRSVGSSYVDESAAEEEAEMDNVDSARQLDVDNMNNNGVDNQSSTLHNINDQITNEYISKIRNAILMILPKLDDLSSQTVKDHHAKTTNANPSDEEKIQTQFLLHEDDSVVSMAGSFPPSSPKSSVLSELSDIAGSPKPSSLRSGSGLGMERRKSGSGSHASVRSLTKQQKMLQIKAPLQPSDVHILVVDDDRDSCLILTRQLKKLNYRTSFATSGLEALSMLLRDPDDFDLVLCDVTMPELSGGQVLKSVLGMPQLSRLPIVMISAADDAAIAQDLVAAGAKDYLTKPIYSSTLASLVGKLKGWLQGDAEAHRTHLSTVYNVTQALFMQIRVGIDIVDDVIDNRLEAPAIQTLESGNNNESNNINNNNNGNADSPMIRFPVTDFVRTVGSPVSESQVISSTQQLSVQQQTQENKSTSSTIVNHVAVRALTCLEASKELVDVLGIDDESIAAGTIDMLSYVHPDDINTIRKQILNLIFQNDSGSQRIQWRWKKSDGSSIPVVGRFCSLKDGTHIVESKSLLPLLLLSEEKKMREEAERRAISIEEKNRTIENLLKKERNINRLAAMEMEQLFQDISSQARILADNPFLISWNVDIGTGNVNYVSPVACSKILQYQINDKDIRSYLTTIVSVGEDDAGNSVPINPSTFPLLTKPGTRIKITRRKKDGSTVFIDARNYISGNSAIIVETELF